MLIDKTAAFRGQARSEETVLIHGASGGVSISVDLYN